MTEEEKYNLVDKILEDLVKDLKYQLTFDQDNFDWDYLLKLLNPQNKHKKFY